MEKFKITLPMLAVFFGFVALIGTAAVDANKAVLQEQSWTFEGGDPTSPGDYQPLTGDITDECPTRADELCGIKAPQGPDGPDINAVPGLAQALEDGDTHPNIYTRP